MVFLLVNLIVMLVQLLKDLPPGRDGLVKGNDSSRVSPYETRLSMRTTLELLWMLWRWVS